MDVIKEPLQFKSRPLIKWTGGKYDEVIQFAHLIPNFSNYYEPFFGGGGVFFAIQPKGICFINDRSIDLVKFYQFLQNSEFKDQLYLYSQAWEQTTLLAKELNEILLTTFQEFLSDLIDFSKISSLIFNVINDVEEEKFYPVFENDFILNNAEFKFFLGESIIDKFKRIKKIQNKEKKAFTISELKQHIETGVKSGLYLYLRSITNKIATDDLSVVEAKSVANWYFVREFCYASMFRYNKKGEFNIPYGGIAYNSRNFRNKVDAIFSVATRHLFSNTLIYNLDFEEFLESTSPSENDFVFLDPPYDSEFSEYDQNIFSKKDQVRLRDAIIKCKGKCMVVIKETEFIREIYNRDNFKIVDFDKTYTYNVRGRNDRGTKHLIILNYEV